MIQNIRTSGNVHCCEWRSFVGLGRWITAGEVLLTVTLDAPRSGFGVMFAEFTEAFERKPGQILFP